VTLTAGLHADIPQSDYLALPYASYSRLKRLRDTCPAIVRYEMEHPPPSTPALVVGSAVHCAVLEPFQFTRLYVKGVEGDGRTKAVKDARAALEADHPGATVLSHADYEMVCGVRDAVAAHPKASRLLEGRPEHTALWTDPETGVQCRGRFDLLSDRVPAVVDLKTCMDASPDAFARSCYQYGYYLQGAMYLQGAQEIGYTAKHFIIVAVEKRPPHVVAVYELEPADLGLGADEVRSLLRTWKRCQDSGVWPGYSDRVERLALPTYAARQIMERIGGDE